MTDVGDVPVQELRDCGVDDDRLMNIITESVKLVMEEVSFPFQRFLHDKEPSLPLKANSLGFSFYILLLESVHYLKHY